MVKEHEQGFVAQIIIAPTVSVLLIVPVNLYLPNNVTAVLAPCGQTGNLGVLAQLVAAKVSELELVNVSQVPNAPGKVEP